MRFEGSPLAVVQSLPAWLPLTEGWIYHQLKHLPGDIQCHIVCERTENLDQFSLPNIHATAAGTPWNRLIDPALRRARLRQYPGLLPKVIRDARAGVLHSHFGNIAWRDLGAARRAAVAHVATFYGFDVGMLPQSDPVWRQRYLELFRNVRRVLCEGPHMLKCIAALGCPQEKLQVHRLGVTLERLPFHHREWTPGEPLRVLMASSFQEKKGIPYGLRALARLKNDVELQVTIIGDANKEARSQAEKTRILTAIRESGLDSNVRLLGYQPHAAFIRNAYEHHVFLAPSVTAGDGDTEGGAPVGLIEAAATGISVVASRHCDIPEVIQDGVTGHLAPEKDVSGLYDALSRLIAGRSRWREMQEAGRRHIEAEYDARCQGVRLGAIYRSVANHD